MIFFVCVRACVYVHALILEQRFRIFKGFVCITFKGSITAPKLCNHE